METHPRPSAPQTGAAGFTPGRAPAWDVEVFKHGDEVQTALITLERNRRTFAWKWSGVDADGLRLRLGPSALTLGGLLKHLALCEELTFQSRLSGAAVLPELQGVDHESTWETWAWESAGQDSPEELRDLWGRAVQRSRDVVADVLAGPGLGHAVDGGMSLRRLLADTIEEYARHTGHADLLREAVDGVTGEGPPADFPVP